MKQFYFSILFFLSFSFYIFAQTTPTGNSTEVGTTQGQLTVSLTGNANYTIPIAVPPGINGVEPQIGLSYNSQKGLTGTAASGWDISGVSSITRIPSTKLHDGTIDGVDFDALDRFALNGQRLIRKDTTATYGGNATVYETEYYSNIRVTSYGVHPVGANYGPAYFLVEYPDGSKELYGNSADSRSVAEWSITSWENAQGIRISYTYSISSNSLILESIKYGSRGIAAPINEIQFTYTSRDTPENYYIAGTNIKRDKNLSTVKVTGNGIGYRNYSLTYQSGDRISQIVEKSGDNTKSYNPTVFEYQASSQGEITYIPISTTTTVGNINSLNAATVTGDFDEDGKMDFLLYPTTGPDAKKKFWMFIDIESGDLNMGAPYNSGAFDEIFSSTFLSSSNKVMPQGWTLVQGNVFTTYAKSAIGIYPQYQKTYTFPQFTYYSESPLSCIKANTPRIATTVSLPKRFISGDFNGDGLTDIAAIELNYKYSYLGPCDIYGEPLPSTSTYSGYTYFVDMDRRLTANFTTKAGRLNVLNTSITYIADFNGDGKSDIYVFDTGKVKVYSLNDDKQFELLTQLTDTGIDTAKPILMGDYNGDGKSDFMIPQAYGNYWNIYNSTGAALLKEEKYLSVIFAANDSYNTRNYIATDFNNDGRTDLIRVTSTRNQADTSGYITLTCVLNYRGDFLEYKKATTPSQPDINIYALPLYLPQALKSMQSGVNQLNNTLEIAFVNQNKIHFFTDDDYNIKKENLLKKITTGDGVQEMLTYIPLNSKYSGLAPYNQIYTPTNYWIASYPNLDIKINPDLFIVSKIEKRSKDSYKKKLFSYYGAVSNLNGLGFIGFRSVNQTDWHDDSTTLFSNVFNNDVDVLRGANTESFKVPYMFYPYGAATSSDFISRSLTTYETAVNPLQKNKVFKLKTLSSKQFSTLNNSNTNSETTDIQYDDYNNITSSKSSVSEGGSLAKTVTTTTAYQKVVTPYIIGRPTSSSSTVTANGHTMTNNESYTYDASQLLSNVTRSAIGTSAISEGTLYDANGNVTKKTITSQVPVQSRATLYEYDPSGRYVTKITDNDNLISTFDYYWENGALKKETNPYGSSSYTIDSWYKRVTAKDDWLNKTTSFAYTKNAEKTIVTTTPDALDGSVSEEIFDDLGRKIRVGSKDINGTFSYVSYLYDIFDRNYKVSEPYFGTTPLQWNETKFDIYSQPVQSILFNNRTVSTSYSGLTTTTTDGLKTKKFTTDAAGNITATNETLGGDITYKYFANGNLKQSTYNDISIDIEQDGWGRKTMLKDPSAGTFTYKNNDFGELTEETSQNRNVVTTITRDPNGKPTKKTIIGGGTKSETNYTYSGILPLTIVYIDNNEPVGTNKITTTITYDTFKRVESIVEDKENVSKFTRSFTYDALSRVATETKTALIGAKLSTIVTKNIYKNGDLYQIQDANNKVLWQTNTVNANGQILESITGNGIKMTNTYNNDGYLSKIQHDKTTTPTANILTLTTAFDKNTDNLDSRINSSFANYTESFKYDAIDRLQKFTNQQGVEETQTYDASGKITGNNLGAYSYDPIKKYQNTTITLNPEATGYYANREGIFNDAMENKTGWGTEKYPNSNFFSYDGTKAGHAVGKNTLKLANTTTTEQYVYSDKWIDINNTVPTQYTYSAWVYSDSPQAEVVLVMKDALNALTYNTVVTNVTGNWTPVTKTFLVPANVKKLRLRLDNNGLGNIWYDDVEIRKTSDPSSIVRSLIVNYNAFKSPSLIEETNVDKISFTYNDDNQRSTMYYGGFQTDKLQRPLRKHYSADGTMEIKENKVTGTTEFVTYIGGDGYTAPIAVKSDGTTPNYLYLHRDYQGTILAVTDANGSVVEKRLFDAWGTIIKVEDGAGNMLNGLIVLDSGYTGHEHLQSVGLINMNARLYDPLLHRFLQADNYIQDPTNTQNYNQYGYVLNNPLLYTDPSGNKYGDGKDCIGCNSDNGELSNGQQTLAGNAIKSIANNWEEWGIKDWAKQNLNFKSWGRSWNKFWGKNGGHDSNPAPQPNLSKYQNITANQIKPIPGMVDKNALEKWTNLPLFERLTTSQPENPYMIANSGGLEFITGEAEFLLLAKGGEKVYEVYHLVNKETKAVEYVGKTGQGIFKRFDQHMLEPAKQAWIHNVEPVLFKGGLSRFGAKYYEQTEILTYKLENLYNKINAVAEKYWIKYRIKK